MDKRTQAVAGADAAQELSRAGWKVQEVVVPDPPKGSGAMATRRSRAHAPRRLGQARTGEPSCAPRRAAVWPGPTFHPACDDRTRESLDARIGQPDLIVSVGSGVINDLVKWLAYDAHLPFVTFATAASMNGYTSANVAPSVRGVKTLIRARPPLTVLADPRIIAGAPYEMTAAGLGDVLAKSVSSADWYLNHLLFGDYYCARSVGLIARIEPLYLEHPEDLRDRKPQAVEALFQALLLTGAAMTMAESSAPSSGAEHMLSHALDMMSFADGAAHDLHGRQVGVGTILASELYRRLLEIRTPAFRDPPGVDRDFWGPLADPVADEFARKLDRYRQAAERLSGPGAWDDLRNALTPMLRPPEVIRDCLERAGAAFKAEHIGCDRKRLLDAFRHAHQIRSRFTVLDLAWLVGLMPGAADAIVAQWA